GALCPHRNRAPDCRSIGMSARSPGVTRRGAGPPPSPRLPAKLTLPRRDDAIVRSRLFRLLDRSVRRSVAWIQAPAGAGKTTLLTTYLRARDAKVLWYDVDPGDADPSALVYSAPSPAAAL